MSSNRGAPKAGKSTINFHRLPLDERHLFEPDAFHTTDHDATNQSKQSTESGSRYTDRRLTTPQLVSALTGIWNLVGQPESSGTSQRSVTVSRGISHKEDHVCFSKDQKRHTLTSCCDERSTGLSSQTCLSTPKSINEGLGSVKKMLMLTSSSSMALSPDRKYEGVLHALKEIFQQEGLQGLYRGLTPRLAISQGAISFTAYKFLKTIMFPEQELPANSFSS